MIYLVLIETGSYFSEGDVFEGEVILDESFSGGKLIRSFDRTGKLNVKGNFIFPYKVKELGKDWKEVNVKYPEYFL